MRFTFFRRSASKPYHERLRALSLFQDLTSKELDIVSGLLHEREYLEHEVLFDEGEEGHAIYIIGINLARHVGVRLRESVVGRRVEQSL